MASSIGLPIEEVVSEFTTLLSVFAREPLLPLGARRIGNLPVAERPYYSPPPRAKQSPSPPPTSIDTRELVSILTGLANAQNATADAAMAAMKFYRAAHSLVGFDPSGAYVSLVSAIECLAGYHFKGLTFPFESVEKFSGVRPILEDIAKLQSASTLVDGVKEKLVVSEHFLFQKFKKFITEHLPETFWDTPDDLYPNVSLLPQINRDDLDWCLRRVYDARSSYLHTGGMYPRHIEFGTQAAHPVDVIQSTFGLRGEKRYLPPFLWFERLTHLVLIEYARRSFAPELVAAQEADRAEKMRLLAVVGNLPETARKDLERLLQWTGQFLGMSVINPHATNRDWASDPESPSILLGAGLISSEGEGIQRSSCLKNRDVGEAVGEFFFGPAKNPFRNSELLLPKNWDSLHPSRGAPKPQPDGIE